MKYIFFDIDGTLTNANPGGIVLPSTHKTLKKLQENGHFVSIATGRSYEMAKSMMKETHIHNMVCCGGNGLIMNDEVLYIEPLEKDKALMIINECKEKDIPFGIFIDSTRNIYVHNHLLENVLDDLEGFAHINYMSHDDYSLFDEIHKIMIGIGPKDDDKIEALKKSGLHYASYHPTNIFVEPDDKYKGIVDMVKRLGGSEEDIVVFGDGHNDLSMMKQANISIAMGNAIDELKEVATFITKDCKEDGIEYACRHFGWID